MKVASGITKYNNKPVQSISDMLALAKRINARLRNSLIETEKEIQHAQHLLKTQFLSDGKPKIVSITLEYKIKQPFIVQYVLKLFFREKYCLAKNSLQFNWYFNNVKWTSFWKRNSIL